MIDGDKHFWMITSVEKQQYQQILNNYYDWVQQSQELLAQTVNPTLDTRTNHFYVSLGVLNTP